jgi:segregation and condensation protein B
VTICRPAAEGYHDDMKTLDAKRVLEAALICSSQPMPLRELGALFADEIGADTIRDLLEELQRDCAGRGVELVALAGGWRFQSRPEMATYLARLNPDRPPRYSRAVMETLAIVAYRQPVTRGEIGRAHV